jgi:hypothetical protein
MKAITEEQMIVELLLNGYVLLKYTKGYNKVVKQTIQHLVCGHIYPVTFCAFRKGRRCPNCRRKRHSMTLMLPDSEIISFVAENAPDYIIMYPSSRRASII